MGALVRQIEDSQALETMLRRAEGLVAFTHPAIYVCGVLAASEAGAGLPLRVVRLHDQGRDEVCRQG